ncbi:hypothetical protein [Polynucleobacter sp. Fuers-14]|uniref:hypothetical protein n=1 Tax=Polynucleobacter sp. Fuers-14 TaxID=1758364 RepID=UPI001C0D8076|nr:hypothetical protein [Polynucleobacter sp. Fuers-14]MBU3641356.1 hypothetical protein [Polynucleobacter sp. Fuers-14]
MHFKPLKIIVTTCLLLQNYELAFACGTSVTQAPCINIPTANTTNNSQAQVVAALQQQALRAMPLYSTTNTNSAARDERFTENAFNLTQQNEGSVVASINHQTNIDRVTFRFPGERIGYQIDSKLYDSLVESKKVIPIGTQFAAVPNSLINAIKSMVIGGATFQKNLLVKVNNKEIELVAAD